MIDAISRFVPGVLSNEESSQFESLQDNLLEYPHYTRPEVWHEKAVPEVLLSGNHKKIEAWRHEQSIERTRQRRPDLLKKSYRVNCAFYGETDESEAAEALSLALSRYGVLIDFNRKKLRKQKYYFEKQDLLVVVAGDCYLQDSGEPAAFANVRGRKTPYVLILTAAQDKVEQTEHKLRELLDQQGCLYRQTYFLPTGERERLEAIALDIRKGLE